MYNTYAILSISTARKDCKLPQGVVFSETPIISLVELVVVQQTLLDVFTGSPASLLTSLSLVRSSK